VAVSFLFHFPSAFAAWGFPSVLPFGVRTFLGSALAARGHPACIENGSAIAKLETLNYGAAAVPVVDADAVSRVAVLGDVHGNAVAFAAVLEEIRANPPDLVVVNGDLSWGPEPETTLAMADGLANALFVRGNAESALLRLVRGEVSEPTETETWMLDQHSPARIAQIESYAAAVTAEVAGVGGLFICHGSPRGDQELVTPGTPDDRMGALLDGLQLDVLVTAHVHLQFERQVLDITSMNAGSVGLQYGDTPAAYWVELGPDVRLRRTPYDLDEAERRVRSSGIPAAERIVQTLREPPSAEEVIEHAERLVASD
jgi:predicted phosphodiesterase